MFWEMLFSFLLGLVGIIPLSIAVSKYKLKKEREKTRKLIYFDVIKRID